MRPDLVKVILLLSVLAAVATLAAYFRPGEKIPGEFDHASQGVDHRAPGAAAPNPPGRFDYYLLVLGWSPAYCASEGRDRDDRQCEGEHPHAFVLHGLWPQYERGWPKDCATRDRAWVPSTVIDAMLPVMLSKKLIIHEYRAHGTCSGLDPAQYFSVARALYDRVTIPSHFADPDQWLKASPEEIERDFVAANAWLKPDMMAVACRGQELLDIRFCFTRDLAPRPCGPNEDEKRLCRRDALELRPPRADSR